MKFWKKEVVNLLFFVVINKYMKNLKVESLENLSQIKFGKHCEIDKKAKFVGYCEIGDNVKIVGECVIENSTIKNGTIIKSSYITESEIGENVQIGPFCNLRKGSVIGDNVKIGAYVEIKNSKIGKDTKIPHFIYVGDAIVGERVNIGCGVVFANYDGKEKRQSVIGNDVFIGCNVNIVAPVKVADKTYICAGTTVTKDTDIGDFVIGRVRQENKKRTNNYNNF